MQISPDRNIYQGLSAVIFPLLMEGWQLIPQHYQVFRLVMSNQVVTEKCEQQLPTLTRYHTVYAVR